MISFDFGLGRRSHVKPATTGTIRTHIERRDIPWMAETFAFSITDCAQAGNIWLAFLWDHQICAVLCFP